MVARKENDAAWKTNMSTSQRTDSNSGFPRLEFCGTGSTLPGAVSVLDTPFHIGRGETCELTLASTHVSRIHAIITSANGCYLIRDNKSTNGTFVNGVRIESQALNDGDRIGIGQIEIRYRAPLGRVESRTAPPIVLPKSVSDAPRSMVTAVRRFQETISHRCVVNRFQPITDIESGAICGFSWSGADEGLADDLTASEFNVGKYADHLLVRYQRVARRVAIEEIMRGSFDHFVILPFTLTEFAMPCNIDDVANLCDLVPSPDQIVIQVPATVQRELSRFPAVRDELRRYHVRLCLSELSLEMAEKLETTAVLPDFALLAADVVTGIACDTQLQRTMANAIRACREKGCEFIAPYQPSGNFDQEWHDLGGRYWLSSGPMSASLVTVASSFADPIMSSVS